MFSDAALAQIVAPIDVLYIDGAHRYAPALADIRQYGARVADGGTMLIHDSFSSIGVTAAIMRELAFGTTLPLRRALALDDDLPRRSRDHRAPAESATPARQLAQLPWFARNVGVKVLLTLGLGKVLAPSRPRRCPTGRTDSPARICSLGSPVKPNAPHSPAGDAPRRASATLVDVRRRRARRRRALSVADRATRRDRPRPRTLVRRSAQNGGGTVIRLAPGADPIVLDADARAR